MRPKLFTFSPQGASLTGHASNVTGASWTITTATAGDNLAHLVTVRNDSVTDHSGKTITLVGTDVYGNAQSETLTAPGTSATVTSTKYFKTVTSATPSATIGADTFDIGWSAVAISQPYPVDFLSVTDGGISVAVTITGTINYDIQHTLDEIFDSSATINWFDHASMAAKTASADGNYAFPIRAIRLLINSVTTGATVSMNILQGSS